MDKQLQKVINEQLEIIDRLTDKLDKVQKEKHLLKRENIDLKFKVRELEGELNKRK